jgi:predicted aspartyl protease
MGHVVVDAELAAAKRERVRMQVDTGRTHSVLPADLAARLGIAEAPRRIKVRLADGRRRAMLKPSRAHALLVSIRGAGV